MRGLKKLCFARLFKTFFKRFKSLKNAARWQGRAENHRTANLNQKERYDEKNKTHTAEKREKGGVNFGVILAKMEFKKKD